MSQNEYQRGIREEMDERERKKRSFGGIKLALVIFFALVFVALAGTAAGLYVYSGRETQVAAAAAQPKTADEETAKQHQEQLQKPLPIDLNDPMFRKIDFAAVQAVNPDVYAWIWIPGTNVDYPILRSETEEDDFYLNHTIERWAGLPGSIYTEKYNAADFSSPVTVVYGHNMKDGSMFANLHNYEDQGFFESNPYVYIYLPGRPLKYRIFAAVAFDDRYILGDFDFADPNEFQRYLDELKSTGNGYVNAGELSGLYST